MSSSTHVPAAASSLYRAVWRWHFIAGLIVWVIGFALNDSGTAIPAVSAILGIPLVIVASISALANSGADPARTGPAPPVPAPPPSPPTV